MGTLACQRMVLSILREMQGLASVIVDSPEYDFKLLTTNKGDIWHEEMAGQST
jgi:hypothetical protein